MPPQSPYTDDESHIPPPPRRGSRPGYNSQYYYSGAMTSPGRRRRRSNGDQYHRYDEAKPKPGITLMNVLLFIAIVLQLYQIYQTPSTVTNHHSFQVTPNKGTFFDFPRGLRDAFGNRDSNNNDNNNNVYKSSWGSHNGVLQAENNGGSDQESSTAKELTPNERMRNYILYGNYDGPQGDEQNSFQWNTNDLDNYNSSQDNNATENGEAEVNPDELPFQISKYNYSHTPNRTKWNLPTQPTMTNNSHLAVIILSGRSNFDRRQAIRETWAQNQTNIVFVIGGPEPDNEQDRNWTDPNSTSSRLFRESQQYGDILDSIHPDTYKALPYKVHYAIRWVASSFPHIQWILKADDDVVVRINTLRYFVLKNFNPVAPMVIGRIEPNSKPHRTGKWAEDPKFADEEYPPWAYGSTGYVMSRPVFDYVASEQSLYYYQGEDASLGIWLYESPLDVSWIDSPDFSIQADQKWYDHQYSVVIGHDVSPEDMHQLFDQWQDPKNLEDMYHTNHTNTEGRIFNLELRSPLNNQMLDNYQFGADDQFVNMFDELGNKMRREEWDDEEGEEDETNGDETNAIGDEEVGEEEERRHGGEEEE
ncbi:acetyllactosaminide beta-1,3-N-acetylglucosaminyltransferase 2 [Seminavis robusta]|uniref:Acetyllactosaminide beta-1,3-N-acetylglucosaminyltransferase 2 n=1 Tax=Seminavis robusta TaxID=568900 RepID=A0A9N8DII4_9STRA|nr:acetyllactosaminide beta-1,3-N-acetylglucosaminyltransferase 2 [Seminavis robusta]|eukprot:Sro176_g077470.1 acetyllactosaminide beta-1,3-N-acetylglucosaminyltransferase 2 (589) ;mRNA; f:70597-72363